MTWKPIIVYDFLPFEESVRHEMSCLKLKKFEFVWLPEIGLGSESLQAVEMKKERLEKFLCFHFFVTEIERGSLLRLVFILVLVLLLFVHSCVGNTGGSRWWCSRVCPVCLFGVPCYNPRIPRATGNR